MLPLGGRAAAPADEVDEIRRQVADVRGLAPAGDVALRLVDRQTLVQAVRSDLDRPGRLHPLLSERKLLTVLGLSGGNDLEAIGPDAIAEQAVGHYDPDGRTLYLSPSGPALGVVEKLTVAHELTHAMHDREVGLESLLTADGAENADRRAAARALVEGDAMLAMLRWGRRHLSPSEKLSLGNPDRPRATPAFEAAPALVRDTFLFPYEEGRAFVFALHRSGGYGAVDQALRDPPRSTEQVIHPEKYLAGEAPRAVPTPMLTSLGEGWRRLKIDVLGELGLRQLLEEHAGPSEAAAGAAGWGGDSFVLLEHTDGRLLLAIQTVWDGEPEAAEFYNAVTRTIPRRAVGTRRIVDQPSLVRWAAPNGQIQLVKVADRVVLVFAPDAETLDLVVTEIV